MLARSNRQKHRMLVEKETYRASHSAKQHRVRSLCCRKCLVRQRVGVLLDRALRPKSAVPSQSRRSQTHSAEKLLVKLKLDIWHLGLHHLEHLDRLGCDLDYFSL